MRFISAITTIKLGSFEHVRSKLERNTTLIIHPETVDQVDFYTVKMRVYVRGKGQGFHTEIRTDLILKETNKGIQLIAYSDLSKALILSVGTAIAASGVFLFIDGYGASLFSFLIIFSILFLALIIAIKRRASELLKALTAK